MKVNKYLLVDYGNTNIKCAIYNPKTQKLGLVKHINKNMNLDVLFKKLRLNKRDDLTMTFVVATINKQQLDQFLNKLTSLIKTEVKIINKDDFNGLLDLSNINKNVVIGSDLLLLGLYLSNYYSKGCVMCLGTVYTCVIMNRNRFESVLLIPNVSQSIANIPNVSSIPKELLPSLYDKTKGLNTPDCFASGANLMLEGLAINIAKTYNLVNDEIVVTGGDSIRYLNLTDKYEVIDDLTIKSLALLIESKKW